MPKRKIQRNKQELQFAIECIKQIKDGEGRNKEIV
jgi:hypothetical protein